MTSPMTTIVQQLLSYIKTTATSEPCSYDKHTTFKNLQHAKCAQGDRKHLSNTATTESKCFTFWLCDVFSFSPRAGLVSILCLFI